MKPHIRIVIDGEVLFDGQLDAWRATPPDQFKNIINPDAKPEPWIKAIMIVMAEAAMVGNSVSIEATTGEDWSMKVSRI